MICGCRCCTLVCQQLLQHTSNWLRLLPVSVTTKQPGHTHMHVYICTDAQLTMLVSPVVPIQSHNILRQCVSPLHPAGQVLNCCSTHHCGCQDCYCRARTPTPETCPAVAAARLGWCWCWRSSWPAACLDAVWQWLLLWCPLCPGACGWHGPNFFKPTLDHAVGCRWHKRLRASTTSRSTWLAAGNDQHHD
jgi:hypothetical protein